MRFWTARIRTPCSGGTLLVAFGLHDGRFMRIRSLLPVLCLSIFPVASAEAATITCQVPPPSTSLDPNAVFGCLTVRDVAIYVGTLSPIGAPASSVDFATSSDALFPVANLILPSNSLMDPRALAPGALPISTTATDFIDWTIGPADNFPALANLNSAVSAQAAAWDALFGPGTLALGPVTQLSTLTYLLVGATVFSEVPCTQPIPSGATCTDLAPALNACPPGSTFCVGWHEWAARFTVFEQNATWTAGGAQTPVPEPASGLLLAAGAGVVWLRQRVRRRVDARR